MKATPLGVKITTTRKPTSSSDTHQKNLQTTQSAILEVDQYVHAHANAHAEPSLLFQILESQAQSQRTSADHTTLGMA